jgi:gluconolactonase
MDITDNTPSVEILATGLFFPEGPAFDHEGNLYIVELRAGQISRIGLDGRSEVFAKPGGGPNGSQFGPDGRLYVANSGGFRGEEPGRVEAIRPDGTVEVVLTEVDGKPLHKPNDLGFDPDGNFYFTDPIWPDLERTAGDSPPGHVVFCDVKGNAKRVHTGLIFPNGIAVTPAGDRLIVCETGTGKLHAFDIIAPGQVGPPRVFCDLGPDGEPDGFAFDAEGTLLVCGHRTGRIHVFPPEGGSAIEHLAFEDPSITNVCFGGPDNTTLFVTESGLGRVVSREWKRPGMILFPDR